MSLLRHHSLAHALLCDTTISTQPLLSIQESHVSTQISKYSMMVVGCHCCQWATDAWLWRTCVCDMGVTSVFSVSHLNFHILYFVVVFFSTRTTKKQIFTSRLSNEECIIYDRGGQTKASSFIVKLCCRQFSGPWWITHRSLQSYLFIY